MVIGEVEGGGGGSRGSDAGARGPSVGYASAALARRALAKGTTEWSLFACTDILRFHGLLSRKTFREGEVLNLSTNLLSDRQT